MTTDSVATDQLSNERLANYQSLLAPVNNFLLCQTPQAWLDDAKHPDNLAMLLTDHLHCELKAAQSAGLLLRRYAFHQQEHGQAAAEQILSWLEPYEHKVYRGHREPSVDLSQLSKNAGIPRLRLNENEGEAWQHRLVDRMMLLMKEELHHFQQVWEIMEARNIPLQPITASRYAGQLLRKIRGSERGGLVDKLIIGAIIEARSCERFAALVPYLDDELAKFYVSLLRSEARHFEDYLALAEQVAGEDIQSRVQYFLELEKKLIETPDLELRFHSGPLKH
ncbi:tRNA isopentenyl-2-thiomethyl-A-37 hydroxylase MiaE [Aliidiomarina haloalkalitolerans]|uniref:tRNA-(Ms[2]io[6]A)-hydroxylase n=1 Tax=Aliidiomarina haloalkalitolerans TaxID=859059 RepID=A0A432VQV5_9GAMM|nr:tRNA isopentenyl-2-thiomethyl-A-37 hydroxylase MiaE [Aliidiomarina haloalkalitolerans]RUO18654.1 tRNA-(ms[2]io[6]A)-hydroxylase [Aliidiomarina haloalkalitolerans]